MLYGLMTEEINYSYDYSYDGGMYPELAPYSINVLELSY